MTNHRAFVLRVWNEEKDEQKQPVWRYVLLDAQTEARRGFTSLDQLFHTLYTEITGDPTGGQLIKREEKRYEHV
ncbi:MAG: hypothetical protein R2911_43150 [Caldilineaceae bacterium]